ncbi:hypothetical protein CABS01_14781 [Colletotrichum abscissum]|uniref:Uncharacterized protein n=1 Tax=Colletotrichum abscissum TaxID=1671311 RepID=A0A9P9X067_9PEZI|nr:uncharacterized protein CABS01_14781 [Colletotrichum abscissum]KAI3527980.1 hypothetical protein CABS02_15238 [Colletotrichum abscissum]KAK1478595.1 hypothetical protein CABS01_14781 [Colletotrichum abscissum]
MSAPYYTPQRPYFSPSNHPSASSSTSTTRAGGSGGASGATGAPSFTPAMRDRQARGKDPYSPRDSPSDSDLEFEGGAGGSPSRGGGGVGRLGHLGPGAGHHGGGGGGMLAGGGVGDGDSHEVRRRKLWAVAVLEDPEKLAMYACSRGDSIPGTRLHFTRMLCGFDEEPTRQQQSDHRKASASSSSARRDPRRRSAGGDRMGRH